MVKIQQCRNQCGQQITVQLDTESGKYKPYDVDPTGSVIGLHNCPNSDYNKQKQWTSSSNKQGGQFTQYKVNQGLEQVTQQTQNAITQKLNELEAIKKLVHDQNILLHTMAEEIKALNNNVIAALVQLGDKQLRQQEQQSGPKKSEEFGEQGENAMSEARDDYDY